MVKGHLTGCGLHRHTESRVKPNFLTSQFIFCSSLQFLFDCFCCFTESVNNIVAGKNYTNKQNRKLNHSLKHTHSRTPHKSAHSMPCCCQPGISYSLFQGQELHWRTPQQSNTADVFLYTKEHTQCTVACFC